MEKSDRRTYLKVLGGTVAGVAVGAAAGYLAKAPEIVRETVTATGAAQTITKTVTATITPTTENIAKKIEEEGKLVVYGYGATFAKAAEISIPKFVKMISDTYGVTVEVEHFPSSSSDTFTKIKAVPGQPPMDVAYMSPPWPMKAKDEGLTVPFVHLLPADVKEKAPWFVDPDGYYMGFHFDSIGIVVDTEQAPYMPTSYKDLTDPAWKDKLIYQYPWQLQYLVIAGATAEGLDYKTKEGEDAGIEFVKKLYENVYVITSGSGPTRPYWERKEPWIGPWWWSQGASLKQDGYAVEWVAPKEGSIFAPDYLNLPKGARAPTLAVEWMKFMFTPEFQAPEELTPAEHLGYAVWPPFSWSYIPDEVKPLWPKDPDAWLKSGIPVDWKYVSDNVDRWHERYDEEVLGA